MSKLAAFFMAVYLFFAGLFYGNAPVQVEILESPFDNGPVTVQVPHHAGGVFEENGQTVTYWNVSGDWAFRCKNTGRPIKGESHYQPTVTLIPAQPDQPELRLISVSDDMVGHDVLIKHGETFTMRDSFVIPADAPAGVWSVKVSVYGSAPVVYENAFVIE